ncbi:MAG: alkaline phosphatase [Candidatus Firestonebacteria bacterium]|nr:alkaline phosphatase [Candidatus Firestonebacteria bacterium]
MSTASKLIFWLGWLLCLDGLWFPILPQSATTAKYVIICHGDGMGPEQVKAGGMFVNGAAGTLFFETFPRQALMTHNNASGNTTDSAASATAMATGTKVSNGVISVRLPGDGSELATLLELHQAAGKHAGLVTTSYMTDASPAAYGAHTAGRNNYADIARGYLTQTQPQILFGGGGYGFDTTVAAAQGYQVVTHRSSLLGLNPPLPTRVVGNFGTGLIPAENSPGRDADLPTLPEMTQAALANLDKNSGGFFVLIEDENIDEHSHANDAAGLVLAMAEFNRTVQTAVSWVDSTATAADWTNTLLVVLADHETGGLTVTEANPQSGLTPAVTWNTTGHTQTPVRIYARGTDAGQVSGASLDNTDIFSLLRPANAGTPTATPTSGKVKITAYPNPAQDHMKFAFFLRAGQMITLTVYNFAGERVSAVQKNLPAGSQELLWDCRALAPGCYMAKLSDPDEEIGRLKLTVLR